MVGVHGCACLVLISSFDTKGVRKGVGLVIGIAHFGGFSTAMLLGDKFLDGRPFSLCHGESTESALE